MFSQEVADRICHQMAEGRSLRSVCRDEAMPHIATVMRWIEDNESFREQYTRASISRADAKFDELDEVSELASEPDNHLRVAGLRLKADNIKWQLARMNSKKYGDKIENTLTGEIGVRTIERRIIDPGHDAS